jgi:large subunit ribosomal protein L28e
LSFFNASRVWILSVTVYLSVTFCCRIYKSVASASAKNGYRADLREAAVARVSALRRAQQPKKDAPAPKPRGAKAKQAAEQE